MKLDDLQDFIGCYNIENLYDHQEFGTKNNLDSHCNVFREIPPFKGFTP